jgi:uncharacterized protein (TIGR00255 family)
MIRSMTGYGRAEATGPRLTVAVEAKSVNHRHLDVAVKLPRALGPLELDVRRIVQSALQRGRIDIAVSLLPGESGATGALTINAAQAREYAEIARRLAEDLSLSGGPTVAWVLEQPGVIVREAEPTVTAEESWPLLERALAQALTELLGRRATEGEALRRDLLAQHAAIGAHVLVIAERAPVAVERRTARLRERMQALLGEATIDESRLVTEVAIWSEKTDITEELARLRVHLDQLKRLLEEGGPVGRALDFLGQEINREANTIGSKADDLEISQAVIGVKSSLEKLREQAQNIE